MTATTRDHGADAKSAGPELTPSSRLLLGPGPSNVHPRVLRACATPLLGHLDPEFLALMEQTKSLLRRTFQTENTLTIPISGTGSAGMEACLVNLIEEDDEVVIGINGVFGTRMADVAERAGGRVIPVEAPWGRIVDPEDVARALSGCRRPKLLALVHAETSTGVWQPLEDVARLARDAGALLVVDTVTSLGGCPVTVDAWGVDACYSGTQKCLSCPPGLSPITLSQAALDAITRRRRKVQSWYLDVSLIAQYWGEDRVYHHTAPITMIYALREALRLVHEEGLAARFARHRTNHLALAAGLQALGLDLAAQRGHRLWMLNSVSIPTTSSGAPAVDDATVRRRLLCEHGIEMGGGLGPLRGKTWRIGLMGESSRRAHVMTFLSALSDVLTSEGLAVEPGSAVAAAERAYRQE
jgi:alanine-glyoxylate transaminase/serine-glyoxylate transaminase/serine-pyruvate transaminase